MKALFAALAVVFSFSALATEFSAKLDRVYCTIANNKVTRTAYVNKAENVGVTETKELTIQGLALTLPKVLETASVGNIDRAQDYSFTMTHEGKTYVLESNQSDEALFLIRTIVQACR